MSHMQRVKETLKKKLRQQPGVVGIGFSNVKRKGVSARANVIKVNFRDHESLMRANLPAEFQGVTIVTEVVARSGGVRRG